MLKITIFGTGGVGGIFAAHFAKAGHRVNLIARGKNLTAIQAHGLQVHTPQGSFQIQPEKVSSTPEEIGPSDLILLCVKTWQLPEARKEIAPLVGPHTLILPLQNGVEAAEFLSETYPAQQILRGFCAVISFLESPGNIRQVGIPPYLCFGELNAPHLSPRVHELSRQLSVPNIVLETPENLLTQQWQKFLFISSLAAVTSAIRLPVGELRQIPETRAVLQEAMHEVVTLGRAKGIFLPENVVEKAMNRVDEMPPSGTTSMQRDFEGNRRTELETFCGYIMREGKKLNIPTPIHRTCYALLLPHEIRGQKITA